jgi:hypothetical protein
MRAKMVLPPLWIFTFMPAGRDKIVAPYLAGGDSSLNDAAPPASLSGEAPVFKFAAVLLLLSWPANAEDRLYYTFSQWARLQDEDRVAYISGLLDTLAMAATEPAQRTLHNSRSVFRQLNAHP